MEKYKPMLERIREKYGSSTEKLVESRIGELTDTLLSDVDLKRFTPKQIY